MKVEQHHRDLFFTLINQLWRLISGPLTMLLIPLFISDIEQGYWYLFAGISALSVFADLGFSNIILQFAAHEFAFLHFNRDGLLEGDEFHLKKLGSFFRFTVKWLSAVCIIVFPIIFVMGIAFFVRDGVLDIYLLPWAIYSIGSLLNFFNNSILSYIEGLNQIERIQKIRLLVSMVNTSIVASILVAGGGIYACAFGLLLSSSVTFAFIFGTFKKLLSQMIEISRHFSYGWRREVLPLFSRYSISWSSGYLIFQIYTPIMHFFHGPVMSGKVGITLALSSAAFSISNTWIYTITPRMNMLVSKKNWESLDLLFKRRLLLSMGTYLSGAVFCVLLFLLLPVLFPATKNFLGRFLPLISITMILTCYFFQLIINSLAIYLRAHKQEPVMVFSLVTAIYTLITTVLSGLLLPSEYFFSGFLSSYLFGLIWVISIFNFKRKEWHQ